MQQRNREEDRSQLAATERPKSRNLLRLDVPLVDDRGKGLGQL